MLICVALAAVCVTALDFVAHLETDTRDNEDARAFRFMAAVAACGMAIALSACL